MTLYVANIRDARRNEVVSREVDATTEEEAMRVARRHGRVISIKKKRGFSFEPGMRPDERQVFLNRLATMMANRVGASESLLLMQDHFTGAIKTVASSMLKHMENGCDVPDAIEKAGRQHFPPTVRALIKAGSRGGNTAAALRGAAQFEVEMNHTLKGSKGMIMSAAAGFLVSIGVIVATKTYFAPMILDQSFTKGGGVDVGWAFTMSTIVEIAMCVVGIILFGLIGLGTIGKWLIPVKSDKIIFKIPVYKDLILARNNYSTVYGLSMLVSSGVPMEIALSLTAESAGKGKLQEDLFAAARAVKTGRPWAKEISSFDAMDRAALGTATDRAEVGASLKEIAQQYRQIYQMRIRMLAPVSQFIAIAFIALAGAVLFSLCVLPILQASAHGL